MLITAKLSFRGEDEEAYSLIVNKARPLEQVSPFLLAFDNPPSFEEMVYIAKVLGQYKGSTPVILRFTDGSQLKTGPKFWVDPANAPAIQRGLERLLAG